jgi:hypothetical protein
MSCSFASVSCSYPQLRIALACLGCSLLLTHSSDAAPISITNTAASQFATTGLGIRFLDFDLTGGNAVVAFVTGEVTGGEFSATYDGAPMTQATINQGPQRASIFYAISPANSVGNAVITSSANGAIAASLLALNNVVAVTDHELGVSSGSPGGNSIESMIYPALPGSFVVGAFVDNSAGAAAEPPTVSGGPVNTTLLILEADTATWPASSGHLHAYGSVGASGIYTDVYVPGSQDQIDARNAAASVVFTAPEPSTLALALLAGLMAAGRRRA